MQGAGGPNSVTVRRPQATKPVAFNRQTPSKKLLNLSTYIKHSTSPKNNIADRFRCHDLRAALIGETEGLSGTGERNNVECSQRQSCIQPQPLMHSEGPVLTIKIQKPVKPFWRNMPQVACVTARCCQLLCLLQLHAGSREDLEAEVVGRGFVSSTFFVFSSESLIKPGSLGLLPCKDVTLLLMNCAVLSGFKNANAKSPYTKRTLPHLSQRLPKRKNICGHDLSKKKPNETGRLP